MLSVLSLKNTLTALILKYACDESCVHPSFGELVLTQSYLMEVFVLPWSCSPLRVVAKSQQSLIKCIMLELAWQDICENHEGESVSLKEIEP